MVDKFAAYSTGLNGPATHAFAITPNDSIDLSVSTRTIRVGGAGDLRITTVGGDTITIPACLPGEYVSIRVSRVWAANTTATLLTGLY